MSTKTTLKRIALVAVSALGFGTMSVIAAPSANALGAVTVSSISASVPTVARAGASVTIPVTFTLPSSTVLETDSVIVAARVVSAPATSNYIARAASGSTPANSSTSGSTSTMSWSKATSGSGSYGDLSNTADSANTNDFNTGAAASSGVDSMNVAAAVKYVTDTSDTKTSVTLNLTFVPDTAGTFSIMVYTGTNAGAYDVPTDLIGLTNAAAVQNLTTTTFDVVTSGAPTTITLSAVTTGAPKGGYALYKATLNGGLLGTEKFTLSSNSSTVSFLDYTGASAITQLINTDFTNGVAYFNVKNTVAETATITATGGGLLASSVTGSSSGSWTTTDDGSFTASTCTSTTSIKSTDTAAGANTTTAVYWGAKTTSTSQCIKITGTAANVEYATVTDNDGKATGKAGATYQKTFTIGSAGTVNFSVPAQLLNGEDLLVVLTASTSSGVESVTITGRTSAVTTLDVTNDVRRMATGGTESFTVRVKDQFGSGMADQTVVVTYSGRNTAKASSTYTSNSSGDITHSFTDTGTSGTSDTLTFTSDGKTDTATVTYGTNVAGTVTLEGPNTDDTLITYADKQDIAAGASGAQAGAVGVTATVKDAAGLVMSGMAVVFTVTGTDCAILSTKVTVYTGAAGTAATSVYKWTNGSCVVTATSGGASGTDTVHFAQKTAGEARTIAATVAGNVITATVKDRFGNLVNGAYVWASRTGGGFFANGASSTSAATGEDGTVQFVYTTDPATAGSVNLALGSSTGADAEYGQSAAGANLVSSTTATDIFTATTVGTATTAETGVGASIAPAGVNSVTVTVAAAASASQVAAEAASDAAAEAIDAANAATDAANLAAEAADAATVAAEEARDAADAATAAVEELATQVATLMAALKAQITTLANTVAKIAKKVKA